MLVIFAVLLCSFFFPFALLLWFDDYLYLVLCLESFLFFMCVSITDFWWVVTMKLIYFIYIYIIYICDKTYDTLLFFVWLSLLVQKYLNIKKILIYTYIDNYCWHWFYYFCVDACFRLSQDRFTNDELFHFISEKFFRFFLFLKFFCWFMNPEWQIFFYLLNILFHLTCLHCFWWEVCWHPYLFLISLCGLFPLAALIWSLHNLFWPIQLHCAFM